MTKLLNNLWISHTKKILKCIQLQNLKPTATHKKIEGLQSDKQTESGFTQVAVNPPRDKSG